MTYPVELATATLARIDDAIQLDQGGSYRQALGKIIPKMDDAYRGTEKLFRSHLGASTLGKPCSRELWYNFRWATKTNHPGKLLRLFNRGHLEEARFLAMLESAGFKVWYETETGGQFKFSDLGGHFGSALDAVIVGIPELPEGTPCLGEFKTSSESQFNKMKKSGMRVAKPDHYTQVQVCMKKMALNHCLYMVVNKNNDELYAEIIDFVDIDATNDLKKAETIVFHPKVPDRINEAVSWWQCRFCDHKPVCKGNQLPEVNCRSCHHSRPMLNGEWECRVGNEEIHTESVYTGCSDHVFNPWALNGIVYHGFDGKTGCNDMTLRNGERVLQGPEQLTSLELKKTGLPQPNV